MLKLNSEAATSQMFNRKADMENFANITGKHVQVLNFIEKLLLHRCFPVSFAKMFSIDFLHYILSDYFLKSLLSYFLKRPEERGPFMQCYLLTDC